MEKLSEIISKNIYSLVSGRKIGYILNVCLDESFKNIKHFLVADDESENEMLISPKSLIFGGEFILSKKEEDFVYGAATEENNLIGKLVFTDKGAYCGKVREVIFSANRLESVICDRICFSAKDISLVGQDAVILGKKKNFARARNFSRPTFVSSQPESLVSISSSFSQPENGQVAPYRISTDPKNLIGKLATRDIFGLNNELIIKKFEIITQKKLNEIKKHNKLNILFYNCK